MKGSSGKLDIIPVQVKLGIEFMYIIYNIEPRMLHSSIANYSIDFIKLLSIFLINLASLMETHGT